MAAHLEPSSSLPLARYEVAKLQAERFNRHVLQYGGALATVLGIGGATGSILALAESVAKEGEGVDSLPQAAIIAIGLEIGILVVAAVVLLYMLFVAYRNRCRAEKNVDAQLLQLDEEHVEKLVSGGAD